jgi:nucleoside-diphosphate-sugar epimerase
VRWASSAARSASATAWPAPKFAASTCARIPRWASASAAYLARTGSYSVERARTLLGYAPAVDLADGMRRTTAWLRAEGLVAP